MKVLLRAEELSADDYRRMEYFISNYITRQNNVDVIKHLLSVLNRADRPLVRIGGEGMPCTDALFYKDIESALKAFLGRVEKKQLPEILELGFVEGEGEEAEG
jgi:hypothetical protein